MKLTKSSLPNLFGVEDKEVFKMKYDYIQDAVIGESDYIEYNEFFARFNDGVIEYYSRDMNDFIPLSIEVNELKDYKIVKLTKEEK